MCRPQSVAALRSHVLCTVQFQYMTMLTRSFLPSLAILIETQTTGLSLTIVWLVVSLYCIRLQRTDLTLTERGYRYGENTEVL